MGEAADGRGSPAPEKAAHAGPAANRRLGHSGIGGHSPSQTVSSRTSRGTRTRPMGPLRTTAASMGRVARKARTGPQLMARSRSAGEADQIAGFLGIAERARAVPT
jgi:hypothetical protein